jgi:hypothetical protein
MVSLFFVADDSCLVRGYTFVENQIKKTDCAIGATHI